MKRKLTQQLISWKEQSTRKPLLLDGARQVGKTYLLEECFGKKYFENVHKFDFRENPNLEKIFSDGLNAEKILKSLELELGKKIDLKSDLIFFDEIGECQAAVDSLKYFCEQKPTLYLCSSGSNIGLLNSFPVGKVQTMELFPMTFYEFLSASKEELLIEEFENRSRLMPTHEKLWDKLTDYYFVGGMPEAVASWFNTENISDKIKKVDQIHKDLLNGYKRDFGKYGGKVNSLHIETVFEQIPRQLHKFQDDSVKRFLFKDIISGKSRYTELRGPIDWLEKSKLLSKNYVIQSRPVAPLRNLIKDNLFKLFFFDLGLLCHSLKLSYQEVKNQDFAAKGFIAENFVQNELIASGHEFSFSWTEAKSEIEFIMQTKSGDIYPLEVKSGKRTKAQSLRTYIQKYKPVIDVKLIGSRGSEDDKSYRWPLYYTKYLNDL